MHISKFLLTIFLLLLVVTECKAQTRRALLIGISNYDKTSTGWKPLHGTNDVALLRTALRKKGFVNIAELKNSDATFNGICKALQNLAGSTQPGDIVYVHLSGHGQPVEDYDGDEKQKGGWDESYIPYDAQKEYKKGIYEGDKHLTDDILHRYIELLRSKAGATGMVYVSIDACHAGDSYRDDEKNAQDTSIIINDCDTIPDDFNNQENLQWSDVIRGSGKGFSKHSKSYSGSDVVVSEFVQVKPENNKSPLLMLESCLSTQRSFELKLKMKGQEFCCGPLSYIIYKVLKHDKASLSNDVSWAKDVKREFSTVLPDNNPQKLVIETTVKSLCK